MHTTNVTNCLSFLGCLLAAEFAHADLLLTSDAVEPVGAVISQAAGSSNIGTDSGLGDLTARSAVGQTFTVVSAFDLASVTMIKGATHNYHASGGATIRLQIFEWTGSDANDMSSWTDAPEGYANISGMTSIYNETVLVEGESYTALDYLHFDLGVDLSLSAGTYGFLFSMEEVTMGADNINFRQQSTGSPYADGKRLNNSELENNFSNVGDLAFYLLEGSGTADYDTWMSGFPSITLPADQLPGGDPDHDGLINEDEYAFGLDPSSGASVMPITVPLDKGSGTLTYTRRKPSLTSLTFSYEWSTMLTGGSWTTVVPNVADIVVPSGDNETVTVDLTGAPDDPLANATLFVRVRATP
ncbi:hypothetical protein [Haloferula sp.]|uniref:hypothetical protein n=1 Tax=Haloferula sp. TaxID=2497595 RepID=UPI00329DA763